jgi:hypothetical protein
MKSKTLSLTIFAFLFIGCGSDDQKPNENKTTSVLGTKTKKQLNINILWDLSDRIDPTKNPSSPQHYQKDIEIIKLMTELFKKDMDAKGAYMSRGKIRVFFTPSPSDENINSIAQNLSKDLSIYTGEGASREKKKVYDAITSEFVDNSNKIYALTIENNKVKKDWDGSDIWRFFKNDADKVIDPDTAYRNILVILTDGYIYHKDSKGVNGLRTQFILPETLKPFRNKNNWQQIFEANDYGLMSTEKSLPNLEVLVLEVSPTKGNRNDEEYIKAYLTKWFKEMNIKKFQVFGTDLPTYTKGRIQSFLASN